MEEEGDDSEDGRDPHEDEHLDANLGGDVELVLRGEGDLGGDADGSGDDGGDADEQAGDECEDGEAEGEPASVESEGAQEHEDEVEDGAGGKEGVHDLGSQSEELQDGGDGSGEGDFGAGEKFADENFDRVEPVEGLGIGAMRDAPNWRRLSVLSVEEYSGMKMSVLIVVAFTEVPQSNLIKVMETQATSYRVQKIGVCDGDGDNLRDIELEEVDVIESLVDVGVSE